MTAALAVAGYRSTSTARAARILGGQSAAEVITDHVAAVHYAFDILDNGVYSR